MREGAGQNKIFSQLVEETLSLAEDSAVFTPIEQRLETLKIEFMKGTLTPRISCYRFVLKDGRRLDIPMNWGVFTQLERANYFLINRASDQDNLIPIFGVHFGQKSDAIVCVKKEAFVYLFAIENFSAEKIIRIIEAVVPSSSRPLSHYCKAV